MTLASKLSSLKSRPARDPVPPAPRESMSHVERLDDHLRLLIGIAAKCAALAILAGRYPSTISLDEDDSADPDALSELASEQRRAKTLLKETSTEATRWLAAVCKHLGIDVLALPDDPEPGPLAVDVDDGFKFDVAFELVLVSIGLAEGAGTGVEKEGDPGEHESNGTMQPDAPLVYSALDRALVVRTSAHLGVDIQTVEGAEKSIAQMLFFLSGEGGEAARSINEWDETAQARREAQSNKNKALKWAGVAGGFVLGGVAIGLTGGLAAPALAPFLVGGLHLAAFGGAGGALLIGTLLGLGGGGLAGYRTHRRLKGLDELTFDKLEKPDVPSIPSLTATIVVSGFLLDPEDSTAPWQPTFEKSNLDTFALKADPDTFLSAGRALDKYIRNKMLQIGGKELLKTTALSALYAGVALPLTVFSGASMVLDSDFSRCRDKAVKAGILLAEILEKKVQGSRPCILVGYGPGATICFEALLELHRRELGSLVFSAILISLPSQPNAVKWASARSVVAHRLVNCYSANDWVLAINARLYTLSARVAGIQPVTAEGVENVDCSDIVGGHLELRGKITDILDRVAASSTA